MRSFQLRGKYKIRINMHTHAHTGVLNTSSGFNGATYQRLRRRSEEPINGFLLVRGQSLISHIMSWIQYPAYSLSVSIIATSCGCSVVLNTVTKAWNMHPSLLLEFFMFRVWNMARQKMISKWNDCLETSQAVLQLKFWTKKRLLFIWNCCKTSILIKSNIKYIIMYRNESIKTVYSSLLRSVAARLPPKKEPTCSPGMMRAASIVFSICLPSVTEPLDSSRGDPVTTVYSSRFSSFFSSRTE